MSNQLVFDCPMHCSLQHVMDAMEEYPAVRVPASVEDTDPYLRKHFVILQQGEYVDFVYIMLFPERNRDDNTPGWSVDCFRMHREVFLFLLVDRDATAAQNLLAFWFSILDFAESDRYSQKLDFLDIMGNEQEKANARLHGDWWTAEFAN